MRLLSTLGPVVAIVALGTNFGCSKEKDEGTTTSSSGTTKAVETKTAMAADAKDVAGLAKETLLVLKFHHDS